MAKLPKWAIRKAGGINKKAWSLYRGRSKRKPSTGGRKTAAKTSRRRRVYRRARKAARGSAGPLVGFATFAGGAYAGEWLTDEKLRPYMTQKGLSEMSQGAALLAGAYFVRRFTNRRGIKNAGQGAAAYMAAKGVGMLVNKMRAGGGLFG